MALFVLTNAEFRDTLTLEMHSRGFDQPQTHGANSFIKMDGIDVSVTNAYGNHRGHSVVVINEITGELMGSVGYDTAFTADVGWDNQLSTYLNTIPPNDRIVAIVTFDEASGSSISSSIIESWGCYDASLGDRESFLFIGTPNAETPSWQTCTISGQYDSPIYGTYIVPLTMMHPTAEPTKSPSLHPTTRPSLYPTKSPSLYPSKSPTMNPTKMPSTNPTSPPSFGPTSNPTTNPTIPTIGIVAGPNPADNPTNIPTAYGIEETQTLRFSTTTTEGAVSNTRESITLVLYIVTAVICAVVVVLILCLVYHCKKQQADDVIQERTDQELPDEDEKSGKGMAEIEVMEWLTKVVDLPQYSSILSVHGFGSMSMVSTIASVSELMDVGIVNEAHLALLMTEIDKLNLRSEVGMDTVDIAYEDGVDHEVLQELDEEIFTPIGDVEGDDIDIADDLLLQEVEEQMMTPRDETHTTKANAMPIDDESSDTDVDDIEFEPQLMDDNAQTNGTSI
eukprot:751326_1